MLRRLTVVLGILAFLCLIALVIVMMLEPPQDRQMTRENMTLEEEFEEYKESGGEGLIPYYKRRLRENGTNASTTEDTAVDSDSTEQAEPPEKDTMEYVRVKSRENNSCLTVIEGHIYNFTSWIQDNPEHAPHVRNFCGAIATEAYEDVRAKGFVPEIRLQDLHVGQIEANNTRLS